ncbi:Putative uncharacterized protein [Taphrina deformans PYCC 5710]|uniref:Calcium channel YVC1-like C-terminal transmembrane domain-containing protein n=1 Tax=Taphrina deformans (strain PYCC 5710 / ATCC 11124 / CBS 356.35 / IMI 108563 / JCM 9778 / NBRC 8474) TaxID=1097556 RepID=R4XB97_TAPDE|nr:Putative uncharacterized protein [Taphrina deformans PYCC 5710]|eukprot:CCG81622.1 Putative uncharacterized protein [Taphrina deformans PYCC 5710]
MGPSRNPFLVSLFGYIIDSIRFEQLRTLEVLKTLVGQIRKCQAPFLIFSLLWCKLEFAAKADGDETTVDYARGNACEIAAMRLLRKYDTQGILQALTNDFKATIDHDERNRSDLHPTISRRSSTRTSNSHESTPLLRVDSHVSSGSNDDDLECSARDRIGGDSFTALEIAIVAEAKHFTSAQIVQDTLLKIWHGEIIFWDDISKHGKKKAQFYNKNKDVKFCNFARLRVPQYAFIIESFNFFILAALYLLVVVDREYRTLGWIEVILALWFLGFTYQEYDQFREAGKVSFYLANPFNYFDLGMIVVALAWIVLRVVGVARQDPSLVGQSYDVLSLQGVLLVPRLFSFLSLSPYFGTLFPCLRRLVTDFLKFLVLIVALYAGFLVTFSILGRNKYSVYEVSWLLTKIFFGSTYLGFDAMRNLHPIYGPPLMIIFVTFSSILLTTALISILSSSFRTVMDNARNEYNHLFATTCLESSKSDHMVILTPPFNLLGLLLVRPLRLFLPSNHIVLRSVKIWILRLTHFPYVLLFSLYEASPFAPTPSEIHVRPGVQGTSWIGTIAGTQRLGSNILNSAGPRPTGEIVSPDNGDNDTDDEEGLDTGIMISEGQGGVDEETKKRIQSMERQIYEMKKLLEVLVQEKEKSKV